MRALLPKSTYRIKEIAENHFGSAESNLDWRKAIGNRQNQSGLPKFLVPVCIYISWNFLGS